MIVQGIYFGPGLFAAIAERIKFKRAVAAFFFIQPEFCTDILYLNMAFDRAFAIVKIGFVGICHRLNGPHIKGI